MATATPGKTRSKVRKIGFAALAVAAVAITLLSQPPPPEPVDTSDFDRQITVALDDYESNNAMTSGAPQQEVVNGWIARDLLTVLTKQTNAMLAASQSTAGDPRIPLLLMLLVLAVCLHALTAPPAQTLVAGGHYAGAGRDTSGSAAPASDGWATPAGRAAEEGVGSRNEPAGTPPAPA